MENTESKEPDGFPGVGPPCPECKVLSSFIGVGPSLHSDKCVEVYQCMEHEVRFEADIVRNKHDKDYLDPNNCV